jgi:hypothetical protein
MLKVYSVRLCLVCVCVVIGALVGTCLDQYAHAAPPSCDNKCRLRTIFFNCTDSDGYQFEDATCFYCSFYAAYQCTIGTDPNKDKKCTDSTYSTTQYHLPLAAVTGWCACDPPGTWTYPQFVEGILAGMSDRQGSND